MPTDRSSQIRVLVVEDQVFLADDLAETLEEAGMQVVGPIGRLNPALELARDANIDAAILDINLGDDERVFPLADLLAERGVPFMFVTGYEEDVIPARHRNRPRLGKPVTHDALLRALDRVVDSRDGVSN
ncbi:MAG: response regulator [Phycisphaerales bacterium]